VQQGRTYVFQTGCGEGAAAGYPTLLELLDPDCGVIAVSDQYECNDGGTRIFHGSTMDGVIYVKVRGVGASAGEFTLAYRDLGGAANACATATVIPLYQGGTIPFTGDISMATPDASVPAPLLQDLPLNWHAFSIQECTDVQVSYCMDPPWSAILNVLVADCAEGVIIEPLWYDEWTCPGVSTAWYSQLPEGDYRVPVLYDQANGTDGAYIITVQAQYCGWLGMVEQDRASVVLRPNPTTGLFSIHNGGRGTIERSDVIDVNGRVVRSWIGSIISGASLEYDVSALPPAVYVLRMHGVEGFQEARLLVNGH
jgi:hypothetical protein